MKVLVQHEGGTRFRATAGEHTVAVDALPQDGGTGTAMSAPQLFAAALGACILEFVVNSCRLHGIPFERLALEVEFEEESGPRRLCTLTATIDMQPRPAEDVMRRLVGVARRATLVNTLNRPPEVAIGFAREEEAHADL